jgi:two-component system response regulator VanR
MQEVNVTEKILIVDDEQEIADLLELYLVNENYTVYKFYTAREALSCIESSELDLAILDIMLPDINGLSICQKIREKHNYPIIMLTALSTETDKITGLTLGADDYVTKPFRPLEVVARVKAQLRRYKKYSGSITSDGGGVIIHSDLVINVNTREVLLDDEPLSLTPTEFSILRILCENKGNVVSSEKLFHDIWGDEYFTKSNNTITVHIRHLREKLGDTMENPRYIKTVWGVGYKIEKSQ